MITILRLGHRIERDKRLSTHVGLAARAFKADKIIFSGQEDKKLIESLEKVCEKFGNDFKIEYEKDWRKAIKNFNGKKIHLTMYGEPLEELIDKIKKEKEILLIVGGEKVPGEVYGLADLNVSVTKQPHSEVSALAVFLYKYNDNKI